MSYETPFFRDLEKLLLPVSIGIIVAFVAIFSFRPIWSEIRFNLEYAGQYNILLDRVGSCFYSETSSVCSSGAWSVSILYVLPLPILILVNIILIRKTLKLRREMK